MNLTNVDFNAPTFQGQVEELIAKELRAANEGYFNIVPGRYEKAHLEELNPPLKAHIESWLKTVPDFRDVIRKKFSSPNELNDRPWLPPNNTIYGVGGFGLYGDVGTGKTYAVCSALRYLGEKLHKRSFVSAPDLSLELQTSFSDQSEGAEKILNRYASVPILVIDDFDKLRLTDFVASSIFALIDARYNAELPLIVTSNTAPAALRSVFAKHHSYGDAIVDRLVEMTPLWIKLEGKSRRGRAS